MIEESGEFLLELHIEQAAEAEVVLDVRGAGFADSVRRVARAIGLRREPASIHDEQPVLCTWYSFHQDLVVDQLLADARVAAELGIGTLIIEILEILVIVLFLFDKTSTTTKAAPECRRSSPMRGAHGGPST